MSMILSAIAASRRRLTSAYDPDAAAWFAAIVTAGGSISTPNKNAVSAFVVGCKADASPAAGISNWAAIKEMCLLCAANDLTGALIPLKGGAPTNNGFVSGNYSRTAGLESSGSQWLESARNYNADPQDNQSMGVFAASGISGGLAFRIMATTSGANAGDIISGAANDANNPRFRSQSTSLFTLPASAGSGLIGVSRSSSSTMQMRAWGTSGSAASTSGPPKNSTFGIFASSGGIRNISGTLYGYWIGESADMDLLDARRATLLAALT